MKNVKLVPIEEESHINQVAYLADKIWREHYGEILEEKQIDYMLNKFQSVDAIKSQINNQNYQYYLLMVEGLYVGFTGIKEEPKASRLFLSKLYIEKDYRGLGYANETFDFLVEICRRKEYNKIWLTVNRHNENAIKAYEKKGFLKAYTQVADIGHGFVMDDYVMEKMLN